MIFIYYQLEGKKYSYKSFAEIQQLSDYDEIVHINCNRDNLTSLPEHLPNALQELICSNNPLTSLPEHLPDALQELWCSDNQLTSLPEHLPNALEQLYCNNNELTSLPEHLPDGLQKLDCWSNELTSLPEHLPDDLQELACCVNKLTSLPEHLPDALQTLRCHKNELISLPEHLPDALLELHCYRNKLTSLPELLPDALQTLWCHENNLTSLPEHLPDALQTLYCNENKLTSLPEHLPDGLQNIICDENKLTSLPEHLPDALQKLYCPYNQITSLPEHLPNALQILWCSDNPELEYINTTNPLPNLSYVYLQNCPKLNPLIITQLERIVIRNGKQDNTNLYSDNQNVHDHQVQKSFIDSVNLLIKNYANVELPDDLILPDSSNNLHGATNLTEKELLTLCVKAIYSLKGDAKEEAYKRLTEELTDGDCKCLTGKMTRMVNALTGFVDGISIGISENAQIQAIYQLCNGDFDKFKKELLERKFSPEVMKMWLEVEV